MNGFDRIVRAAAYAAAVAALTGAGRGEEDTIREPPEQTVEKPGYSRIDLIASLIPADPLLAEALPFTKEELEAGRPKTDLSLGLPRYTEIAVWYLKSLLKPEYLPGPGAEKGFIPIVQEGADQDDYLFLEYEAGGWYVRVRDSRYLAVYMEPLEASVMEWEIYNPKHVWVHAGAIARSLFAPYMPFYKTAILGSPAGSVTRYYCQVEPEDTPAHVYADGFFVFFIAVKTPDSLLRAEWEKEAGRPLEWEERWKRAGELTRKFIPTPVHSSPQWNPADRMPGRIMGRPREPQDGGEQPAAAVAPDADAERNKSWALVGAIIAAAGLISAGAWFFLRRRGAG